MNHLEPARTAPDFAEAAHADARLELLCLGAREIEEAQRQLPGAIAETNEQRPPPAEHRFREQHFAAGETPRSRDQCAETYELRTVLVAQRQQKEQILDALDAELREFPGEGPAHSPQGRYR